MCLRGVLDEHEPCSSQSAWIASASHGWPKRSTPAIALVFEVIAAAASSTSIWPYSSQSTSTGRAPSRKSGMTVAMKVFAGASTSSPRADPDRLVGERERGRPRGDADAVGGRAVRRPLLLEPADFLAEDVLRRGDRVDQRRVDLILDRGVLSLQVDEVDLAHGRRPLPPAPATARTAHRRRDSVAASSTATTRRPAFAICHRSLSRHAAADELGDLLLQRLARRDLRNEDVAVANHGAILAELGPARRLGDRVVARSLVEHLQLLVDRDVVEDDHALVADGGDAPHLVRIEPRHVDAGDRTVVERRAGRKPHPRPPRAGTTARWRRLRRLVPKRCEQDRKIVRREIPEGVHVLSDRPEPRSRGVRIEQTADAALSISSRILRTAGLKRNV